MPRSILTLGLIGCVGCVGNQAARWDSVQAPAIPPPAVASLAETSAKSLLALTSTRAVPPNQAVAGPNPLRLPPVPAMPQKPVMSTPAIVASATPAATNSTPLTASDSAVSPVQYAETASNDDQTVSGTLKINGQEYRITLENDQQLVEQAAAFDHGTLTATPINLAPQINQDYSPVAADPIVEPQNLLDLNLPSALAMIGGQHPAVGFAQWRVQQAYAELDQAKALWLPSIQTGFSFHRHDGNYQASNGSIVNVNRNSFQYGLGSGATGAGTTPRPGLIAEFHFADAIFQPKIAGRTARAWSHAAGAVKNKQLLDVSLAYIELVGAHQDSRILDESRQRTLGLSKITEDFAAAGQGLRADADRMRTETLLAENRLVGTREQIEIASAKLAQALSLDSGMQIFPLDVNAVPLELVTIESDAASLIGTGLASRPELKESGELVAAACEAYRREKYAPFVPSVVLGLSTSGFGGGLSNHLDNVDSRYDLDAAVSWNIRNLGLGEKAARRRSSARVQQAKYEKLRVMDQIAREISEAHAQLKHRRQQITLTQQAIQSAEDSYQRNLERIRDGQGLPLEVLQSVQALEAARRAYLDSVISHNQSQFQLQWALGWPVTAPASADYQ